MVAFRTDVTIPPQYAAAPAEPISIAVPGETSLEGWQVTTQYCELQAAPHPTGLVAHLDAASVGKDLLVRRRRQGDQFQPLGMCKEKKLQDFMVDARIPAMQRDAVPLLCSEAQIAWVVGWRINDSVKVTPKTTTVLRVEFTPQEP